MIKCNLLEIDIRQPKVVKKSYADVRTRELDFKVDDWFFLKVSPMKGVIWDLERKGISALDM